jgi:hypothetical protein
VRAERRRTERSQRKAARILDTFPRS